MVTVIVHNFVYLTAIWVKKAFVFTWQFWRGFLVHL